ncbi:HD domain-containing protein [Clostridium sp. DJ247]|uniref:HD domain-containing protein n=1 Tax=Clostridium sp. DJ247 TaxID=2726188 RepID=UPI0016256F30|nr:HD domain-containing protein [Clostridium sp. DJ247]MBC2580224.1 HD domain-containing protein [Clostridium sp. DJ247]
MNKENLSFFYSWFDEYIKGFCYNDPKINANILYKKEHTFRVCDNAVAISKSLNLSEREHLIAETIGLFHDVGRFKQFAKYKTFRDTISEDHANLGISVLQSNNVLNNLDEKEREVIYTAIKYHNKYAIPDDIPLDFIIFSKLIRDADKLDIFDLLVNYYENPCKYENEAFEDFQDSQEYQLSFVENIIKGKMVPYDDVKTKSDIKLLRISWIYDINFNHSLKIIKHKRYIERIIDLLPKTEDIKEMYIHINAYIESKINN